MSSPRIRSSLTLGLPNKADSVGGIEKTGMGRLHAGAVSALSLSGALLMNFRGGYDESKKNICSAEAEDDVEEI